MYSPWEPGRVTSGPYCASPFMGQMLRWFLDHAAQLGNHVQTLLLAQVLGTHDRLLVEQVAGASLLLEVTLDHVDGPIHLLAGNLFNPLVGDGDRHIYTSSPRRFDETCNVCSALPDFRVKARHALVKNIFGEHFGSSTAPHSARGPSSSYRRSTRAFLSRRGTTGTVFSARQKSRSFSYPRRTDIGRRCSGAGASRGARNTGPRPTSP